MKNFLPKSKNNPSGFTLIELMVVISIIAFLAVIGIAAYSQTQKTARDGRRKADIDAISQAMETNYNAVAGAYLTLADSMFANGTRPTDPGTNTYVTTLYPSGCSGTATGTVCRAFSSCATLENTTQGNSAGVTFTAGTPDTLVLNSGATQFCRVSQQSI